MVGQGMDLGGSPATRAADGLTEFPSPFFLPEAQRYDLTVDESISTSASGPPADARAWKMFVQTP